MATASKNIIAELNKSKKPNGDNYEIWSLKIQYVLEEQEALEVLNHVLDEPKMAPRPNIIGTVRLIKPERKRIH